MGGALFRRLVQSCLVAIALAGLGGALDLGFGTGDAPGPGMFPGIASGALLALALAGLAARAPRARAGEPPFAARRLASYVAGILLLGFSFGLLGYPAAAFCALIVVLVVGERLSWGRAVLIAVLAAGATTALFALVLGVPLPMAPAFAATPLSSPA